MKQKNLVLIAVAVGCGLVAAFLTTQMGATPAPKQDLVQAPMTVKAISVNTALTKETLDTTVQIKAVPREQLPPNVILDTKQLLDKRVIRAKVPGEFFITADVSSKGTIELPPGHNMFTIRLAQDEGVGGWAVPGARVDIVATVDGSVFPLFKNMLIVAIGATATAPTNGPVIIDNVSLAMEPRQTELLALAMSRGARFRMALRNPDATAEDDLKSYRWNPTMEELFTAFDTGKYGGKRDEEKKPPTFVALKLPVPKEDLPAGTHLTKELIAEKFTTLEINPPAPSNMIDNIGAFEGQYVVKDLVANLFIPEAYLADSYDPQQGKPGPADVASTPKAGPDVPKPMAEPEAPPEYHDIRVVTNAGVVVHRYQKMKQDDGSFKWEYLGVVKSPTEAPKSKPAEKPSSGTGPRVQRFEPENAVVLK